jgi:phage terminase large subunit-like protein
VEAENSLYSFVKQAWSEIENEFEFVPAWFIEAVCEHLEALHRGDIKDLIIAIPPRATKSTICSVMFPAWAWVKTPSERFLCLSHSDDLSIEHSIRHRDIVSSDWYNLRWGDRYSLKNDQNEKRKFSNTKGGYRISKGILGRATGRGATTLIADDINNSTESERDRAKKNFIWSASISTRMNNPSKDKRLILAQRTSPSDLINHLLNGKDAKNWTYMMLPMEYDPDRACETIKLPSTTPKKWKDPRTKKGETLCPIRFNKEALDRIKAGLGSEYIIQTQLQQNPSIPDGGLFKKSWFRLWKEEKPPKVIKVICSLDTAFKGKSMENQKLKRSFSVCTTWGLFNDKFGIVNVILLNMWRDQVEYPDLRKIVKKISENYLYNGSMNISADSKHVPDMILIESKASGEPLRQDLRRVGVATTGFNPDPYGDKIRRASLVTHIPEAGRVWIPARGPHFKEPVGFAKVFLEACGNFPNEDSSKDIIDTFSQFLLKEIRAGGIKHPDDPKLKNIPQSSKSIYGVDMADDY